MICQNRPKKVCWFEGSQSLPDTISPQMLALSKGNFGIVRSFRIRSSNEDLFLWNLFGNGLTGKERVKSNIVLMTTLNWRSFDHPNPKTDSIKHIFYKFSIVTKRYLLSKYMQSYIVHILTSKMNT